MGKSVPVFHFGNGETIRAAAQEDLGLHDRVREVFDGYAAVIYLADNGSAIVNPTNITHVTFEEVEENDPSHTS